MRVREKGKISFLVKRSFSLLPRTINPYREQKKMQRRCRIAIIGFGQRGYGYAQLVKSQPCAELAAICESSAERAECFARELGLESVPRYSSIGELLAHGDFDAAIITLPDFLHRDCAVACCRAGKPIMLEKPMAPSAAECRDIIRAARENSSFIQIGFVLRHHPVFRRVLEIVRSGELGQIMNITASEDLGVMHGASYMRRWHRKTANSGGFMLAKCSHDIDIISAVAGAPARRAAAFGSLDFFTPDKQKCAHCSECPDTSCRFRFHGEMVRMSASETARPAEKGFDLCVYNSDKDIVDHEVAIIDFANGVKADFSLNLFAEVPKRTLDVRGSEAFLHADTAESRIVVTSSVGAPARTIDCTAENASGHGGSDLAFVNDFVDRVMNRRESGIDYRAGLSSTVIGNALEKSLRTGRVVEIAESEYRI